MHDWCNTVIHDDRFKGYCETCYYYLNPELQRIRHFKARERAVMEFIKEDEELSEYTWIFDRVIAGGISHRRPDAFLDLDSHVIIVEVDENAHDMVHYKTPCELQRTEQLFTDVAYRPVTLIRFNPDSYIDDDNTVIPSCFRQNGKDPPHVADTKAWDKRLR